MKNTGQTAIRFAAVAAFLALLTATALKAEPRCSQATLSGTYVTAGSGTLGANTTGAAAYAAMGKVTYDGRGNGDAIFTQSVAGTISRKISAAGTYTVNADCTGSKNFGGPSGTNYDFVVTADGREIIWIVTNAGAVLSGRAIRLDDSRTP